MDERLIIVDRDGYSIEVDDNWGGRERAKKKLIEDPNSDVVFIAINEPFGEQSCVALTLGQAKELVEGLQSLIKELE